MLVFSVMSMTGQDSRYTESSAMSRHRTEPERALVMIDSAVLVGNISWQRGEYLKAVTQYGGLHDLPLAAQTCLNMLEKGDVLTDTVTIERTYMLLAGIEYTLGNHPAIIRYATEASRLAHILNQPGEVGKAAGLIAQSMAQTGKTDEGIELLNGTISELRDINTFEGVTAYHEASKKLIRIYIDNLRFADVVPVCEADLARIDKLDSHPERFNLNEGFDPSEFVDYARGQALAYLTIAYARMEDIPKARETMNEVLKTNWSHSVDCDKIMSAAYLYMGEFDRFEKAMQRFEHSYPDTINPNYVICLEQRFAAARMQGHTDEAIDYMQRIHIIRDSLDARNQRERLHELATQYHLQEEQFIRQQKEAEAERARIIIITLTIGLLVTACFLLWFFRQERLMKKKNKVLAREIADAITYKEKYLESLKQDTESGARQEPSDDVSDKDPDVMLFNQIQDLVAGEKLFLDPNLDRQMLVDRLGVSKERVGAAFAKGSPYKSLIEYLNDCRLPYAAKLLTERPDLSVADVAHESGFANADTLGRNFKVKYALTPTEYREQQ